MWRQASESAHALRCVMYPHRRVVGALKLTISASRGGQMYHTFRVLPFRLQECLCSYPKAILSSCRTIGDRLRG